MFRRSAGGAVAAAACAVMLTATAASAATAYIHVTSATLLAKGAAVRVTVTYQCPVGQTGTVYADVNEVSGHQVTEGYGYTTVTCTGSRQYAGIIVTPYAGQAPFKRGDAVIQSQLNTCTPDYTTCTYVQNDQVVMLTK